MERFEIQEAEPADLYAPEFEDLTTTKPGSPVNPVRTKPQPPALIKSSGGHTIWLIAAVAVCGAFVLQHAVRRLAVDPMTARPTERSLDWVVAVRPRAPEAWAKRAAWHDRVENDSQAAVDDLREAVRSSPTDYRLRLALAAQLERSGKLDDAERALKEAIRFSRRFEPRWALADFYLRQAREDDFWTAIRGAVEADPERTSVAAAFCWRAFDDSDAILNRAMPDRPEVNRQYFAFLSALGDLKACREAWPRFLSTIERRDITLAGQYIDELISSQGVEEAVQAWNAVIDAGLLSHIKLDPERGRSLTNGRLEDEPSGFGFDWRPITQRGVSWMLRPADVDGTRALEFRFNGAQDSQIVLMRQFAPVLPNRKYSFDFGYATQNMPTDTGVGWAISDGATGASLSDFKALPVAENYWDNSTVELRTGANTRYIALEFGYRGTPGVERTNARFVLRRLDLALAGN